MHELTTRNGPDARSLGGRIRLTAWRRLAGLGLAAALLPALTAVLAFLLAVVVVASVGGLWPALAAAVGSSLLLNYYFTAPLHRFAVADRDDAIALTVFIAVAVAVSTTGLRQRRLADAAASAAVLAEVDRTRAALLTAVSHDLRSPLASAKTAVSALSADDLAWTGHERTELLATADESLDRLTRLVENLLDMSRLQAGAPAVLAEFGDAGRRIELRVPPELPELLADPGLLERILANLLGNALRHSPPD